MHCEFFESCFKYFKLHWSYFLYNALFSICNAAFDAVRNKFKLLIAFDENIKNSEYIMILQKIIRNRCQFLLSKHPLYYTFFPSNFKRLLIKGMQL